MTGPTILDVIGDWFPAFLEESWRPWRAFLSVVFGLPIADIDRELVGHCTGRTEFSPNQAREAWVVVGRRGGKSRIAALLVVFLACFRRYTLAPGERGVVMLIASDRKQAKVVLRYVRALIDRCPSIAAKVVRRTAEAIEFNNGVAIEVGTASFRSLRGYTVLGAVLDEVAYWPNDESANPDSEIVAALRPAMATIPGALMIPISSPYAQKGELWRAYKEHFGRDGDPILVWQAGTRTMNPDVPQDVIDRAYLEDESKAAAEYGAIFRSDLETFIARDVIERVIVSGRTDLVPDRHLTYRAFVDASGGRHDSFAMSIAHQEGERVVVDLVAERRPPFSPDEVVRDFAAVLKSYRVHQVTGDAYGAEWVSERFRVHGIDYQKSALPASELFRNLLPAANSGRVELPDHPVMKAQFLALERRVGRTGRDSIGHPDRKNAHDDVAAAVAGAVSLFALGGAWDAWAEWVKQDVTAAQRAAEEARTTGGVQVRETRHGGDAIAEVEVAQITWGTVMPAPVAVKSPTPDEEHSAYLRRVLLLGRF